MTEAINLRGKLTEVLYKLSSLTEEYHEILMAKKTGQEKIGVYPIEHKRKLLDTQAEQLLSDYEAIEAAPFLSLCLKSGFELHYMV
jgi:hypothetical protein